MTFDETPAPDYRSLLRLDGKVFVILGAGQGIGRQAAHALSQAGACVVCVGRRAQPTERVASEVGGVAITIDAQDRRQMERLFAEVERRFGRLDGIVDILGGAIPGGVLTLSDEDYASVHDASLRHAFLALQLGAPLMRTSGGGSAVLISSVAGQNVWPGGSLGYAMFKAALDQLVRATAVELGPLGIRVNAVAPGLTRTPKLESQSAEWFETAAQSYPLRRAAEASDIAAAILFLASEMARNITGQIIVSDGGLSIQCPSPVGGTQPGSSLRQGG